MRVYLAIGLMAFAFAGNSAAQQAEPKPPTSQTIQANLQTPLTTAGFGNELLKFKEVVTMIHDLLKDKKPVTFVVDDEAFKEESPDFNVYEAQVTLSAPAKTKAIDVLRQALKQLPVPATFVIRAGRVDIVPVTRTAKEWMLNQTVAIHFKDRPLDAALDELSELTGVSIIMDTRAKGKAQTPVSARFRDDVAVQDAVRMLTDMAELKMVYMVTGIYITTPEHAATLQKELKKTYGEAEPTPPVINVGGAGIVGGVGMIGGGAVAPPPDPNIGLPSLFTPPLPPRRKKLEKEGAFRWSVPDSPAAVVKIPRLEAPRPS